jgi:hypothetical protein
MAEKDRLNNQRFTCTNSRFHTNTDMGMPHGQGEVRGSVFDRPLLIATE